MIEDAPTPINFGTGNGRQANQICRDVGHALESQNRYFVRNFKVCKLMIDEADSDPILERPSSAEFSTGVEDFIVPYEINLKKLNKDLEKYREKLKDLDDDDDPSKVKKPDPKDPIYQKYTMLTDSWSRRLLDSGHIINLLPPIRAIFRCPMLVDRGDQLDEINSYDRSSAIWCRGKRTERMELDKAVGLVRKMLNDFDFISDGDYARAIAMLLTPAMHYAGVIGGRIPFSMVEADCSQAGKGYLIKIVSSIYNVVAGTVSFDPGDSSRRGVGSDPIEKFSTLVANGHQFIVLDNIRGSIKSPELESFATEDRFEARKLRDSVTVNPNDYCVFITSNSASMNTDMVNRSSIMRIRKLPDDYQYYTYTGQKKDDILSEIRNNRQLYLGAVFTIVKEWYENGKRSTPIGSNMDTFNIFFQTMNTITKEYFGIEDITEGVDDIKLRVTSRTKMFLRSFSNLVNSQGALGRWLAPSDVDSFLSEDDQISSEMGMKTSDVRKLFGQKVGTIFRNQPENIIWYTEVEGYIVQRKHEVVEGNTRNYYRAIKKQDHVIEFNEHPLGYLAKDDDFSEEKAVDFDDELVFGDGD